MKSFYIKEEKLNNGKSRHYPILKESFENGSYWNEEYILTRWYPAEKNDYCGSYQLALSAIDKHKEYLLNVSPEVEETIIHEIN